LSDVAMFDLTLQVIGRLLVISGELLTLQEIHINNWIFTHYDKNWTIAVKQWTANYMKKNHTCTISRNH